MASYYLAIDPGRDKFGLAVVDEMGNPLQLNSVEIKNMEYSFAQLAKEYSFARILMGDGTGKKKFTVTLQKAFPQTGLSYVDERDTTLLARRLYWQINPPNGIKKFLPTSLLAIPEPVDAYAALVIARRWLNANKKMQI